MDPLSDCSQATHFPWLFTFLTNQITPLWPVVNGTCGCSCNADVGPSTCLQHFLLLWPQRQLVTSSLQCYILNISAPPTVLVSAQAKLDGDKILPLVSVSLNLPLSGPPSTLQLEESFGKNPTGH